MLIRSLDVVDDDYPLIGYDQIITEANIAADSSDPDYPVTRLANRQTHKYWQSLSQATQYITVTTDGVTPVDYLAVIGHNFAGYSITASWENYISGAWVEIGDPIYPDNGDPIVWQVAPQVMPQFRLKLEVTGSVHPRIAVLQAGQILTMEQRIYSQHVPLPYGFKTNAPNGWSESGNFLGKIVVGETRESTASFKLITPEWFRTNIPAFMESAQTQPFVFVWRPAEYPEEVGYAVLKSDLIPAPADPAQNNLIAFDLHMEGVA